ncbi:hypothetical protein [Infirmifilum uzonense]|nr:hypothetical protein [Infirmifilum uzonense]
MLPCATRGGLPGLLFLRVMFLAWWLYLFLLGEVYDALAYWGVGFDSRLCGRAVSCFVGDVQAFVDVCVYLEASVLHMLRYADVLPDHRKAIDSIDAMLRGLGGYGGHA